MGLPQQGHCLPNLLKLYIYGLHGYLIEVTFTALWNLFYGGDWRLQGCSSIWSLGIYGTCGLALEHSSKLLRDRGVSIYWRALVFVLLMYFWEFTSGSFITLIGSCPWNYADFRFNLAGLITLEYAPFWLGTGLVMEQILIPRLNQLRWTGKNEHLYCQSMNGFASTNGVIKPKQ